MREEEGPRQAELHYGFTFGTGVVYGFLVGTCCGDPLRRRRKDGLARGIGSTLVQGEMIKRMARAFPRLGAGRFDGGGAWPERDYLAVAAGTIDHIGLNFRPFYRYAEQDEGFHALGIHASPLQFVGELPRIWRAEPMRSGRTYEACETRMVVRSADGQMQYTDRRGPAHGRGRAGGHGRDRG